MEENGVADGCDHRLCRQPHAVYIYNVAHNAHTHIAPTRACPNAPNNSGRHTNFPQTNRIKNVIRVRYTEMWPIRRCGAVQRLCFVLRVCVLHLFKPSPPPIAKAAADVVAIDDDDVGGGFGFRTSFKCRQRKRTDAGTQRNKHTHTEILRMGVVRWIIGLGVSLWRCQRTRRTR